MLLGATQQTTLKPAPCKIALQHRSSFTPAGLPSLPCARRVRLDRSAHRVSAVAQPLQYDPEKEESLKYKRVVFDFDKWAKHRSNSRYTRHVLTMLTSRVVRCLAGPILAEAFLATSITIYQQAHKAGELPDYLPALPSGLALPFGLSSFALSLLLAYRVKESYGRFDEVRKFWGGVVNRSRDFVRQGTTWLNDVEEREAKEMLVRWMIAFPWSMMCHLRAGEDLEKELKDYLKPNELQYLLSTPHRPNTVLQVLSDIAWKSGLPQDKKFRMDENLTLFADMLGASERILRTPLPVSYTRHTSRFLVLWLFFLPLAIVNTAEWATIPSCILIAFLLLATDEVGVQVEEPFSVLPLEAISATITTNMKQHLAQDRPEDVLSGGGSVSKAVEEMVAKSMKSIEQAEVPASKADLIAKLDIDMPMPAVTEMPIVADIPIAQQPPEVAPVAPITAIPVAQQVPAVTPVPTPVPKPNGTTSKPANGNGSATSLKVPIAAAASKKPLSRFDRKLLEYMQKKVGGNDKDRSA